MVERILGLTVIQGFWIWIILIGAIGMDLEKTTIESEEARVRLTGQQIWDRVR